MSYRIQNTAQLSAGKPQPGEEAARKANLSKQSAEGSSGLIPMRESSQEMYPVRAALSPDQSMNNMSPGGNILDELLKESDLDFRPFKKKLLAEMEEINSEVLDKLLALEGKENMKVICKFDSNWLNTMRSAIVLRSQFTAILKLAPEILSLPLSEVANRVIRIAFPQARSPLLKEEVIFHPQPHLLLSFLSANKTLPWPLLCISPHISTPFATKALICGLLDGDYSLFLQLCVKEEGLSYSIRPQGYSLAVPEGKKDNYKDISTSLSSQPPNLSRSVSPNLKNPPNIGQPNQNMGSKQVDQQYNRPPTQTLSYLRKRTPPESPLKPKSGSSSAKAQNSNRNLKSPGRGSGNTSLNNPSSQKNTTSSANVNQNNSSLQQKTVPVPVKPANTTVSKPTAPQQEPPGPQKPRLTSPSPAFDAIHFHSLDLVPLSPISHRYPQPSSHPVLPPYPPLPDPSNPGELLAPLDLTTLLPTVYPLPPPFRNLYQPPLPRLVPPGLFTPLPQSCLHLLKHPHLCPCVQTDYTTVLLDSLLGKHLRLCLRVVKTRRELISHDRALFRNEMFFTNLSVVGSGGPRIPLEYKEGVLFAVVDVEAKCNKEAAMFARHAVIRLLAAIYDGMGRSEEPGLGSELDENGKD
jgi:uncharacterized protein YeaO (DUF488 family)